MKSSRFLNFGTSLVVGTMIFAAQALAQPTFSKEVSRLLQAKCQNCHRAGDIAPFPLTSYTEVNARLTAIKAAVSRGKMPPWKPSAGPFAFRDNYGMSEAERKVLIDWIDSGAPEGNPEDLPPTPAETGEWQLGEPDLTVEMAEAFEVPDGGDTYRCFVLPYELSKLQWLSAVQVVPGNRAVAHHALLFLDPDGVSLQWDGKDGKPGYDCFGSAGDGVDGVAGAWVPGARIQRLPADIGIPLPPTGRLILQLHYHSHGGSGGAAAASSHGKGHSKHSAGHRQAVVDRSKVGLYFNSVPPKQEMVYAPLETEDIEIPAGEKESIVVVEEALPFVPLETLVVGPHMHLLGRSIKLEKLKPRPSNEAETLIEIADWDFDYQGFYTFENKVPLEPAARLRVTCKYDNSENNPKNPNQPPAKVVYGERTTDEMCLVFVGIVLPEGISVGENQEMARRVLRTRKMFEKRKQ